MVRGLRGHVDSPNGEFKTTFTFRAGNGTDTPQLRLESSQFVLDGNGQGTQELKHVSRLNGLPLPYFPTAAVVTTGGKLLVAGKNMTREAETVLYEYTIAHPSEDSAGMSVLPATVTGTRLVLSLAEPGKDMVRSMKRLYGRMYGAVLVEFYDSRDVWIVHTETGALVEQVISAGSFPHANGVPEYPASTEWDLYCFGGDHITEGYVYGLCGGPGTLQVGFSPTDVFGLCFRDGDRNGTIDEVIELDSLEWFARGFGESSNYNEDPAD
jgi:hypothetical protein